MNTLRRKLHLALLRLFGRARTSYAPHGIEVQVPHEVDLKLRYNLARSRPYEAAEAAMISAYLHEGMPVIELGGCLGIISALIRSRIGADARHIVVEANPELVALCTRNAAIGAAPGATEVVPAAIDYSGAATVRFSTGKTAHVGHISADGAYSVATTTLSALAEKLPAGPFALVCDIEGGESALIDHEGPLLGRVALLVLETHPKVYPTGAAETERLVSRIEASGLRKVAQDHNVLAFVRH